METGAAEKYGESAARVAKTMSAGDKELEKLYTGMIAKIPEEDKAFLETLPRASREAAIMDYITVYEATRGATGKDPGSTAAHMTALGGIGGLSGAALGKTLLRGPGPVKLAGLGLLAGAGAGYLATPEQKSIAQWEEPLATGTAPPADWNNVRRVGPFDSLTNWNDEVLSQGNRPIPRLKDDAAAAYQRILARRNPRQGAE